MWATLSQKKHNKILCYDHLCQIDGMDTDSNPGRAPTRTTPPLASTSLHRCHLPDRPCSEESWEADLIPKIEQEVSPATNDEPETKNEGSVFLGCYFTFALCCRSRSKSNKNWIAVEEDEDDDEDDEQEDFSWPMFLHHAVSPQEAR